MDQKKIRVFNKIIDKIKQAKSIALISHRNPDGDTIGSATAFYEIVLSNFPNKKLWLYCVDKIPKNLSFINNSELYKSFFDPEDYDLVIFFDSGSKNQTWYDIEYEELFDWHTYNTIWIDHHRTNEVYCRQNLILTTYASTSMIVYELFKNTWYYINPNRATSLLTGIFTDTWWLKHSNVNSLVYEYVAEIVKLGAQREIIIENVFWNNSVDRLRLWWRIIDKAFIDKENILYTYINKTDIDSFWVDYEDVSWITDLLNSAENIKYSVILTQKWEYVKWSLRTLRDDVDLSDLAKKHWWWWHKKASGFTVAWNIEELKKLNF